MPMKHTLILNGHVGLLLATAILSLVIVLNQTERTPAVAAFGSPVVAILALFAIRLWFAGG